MLVLTRKVGEAIVLGDNIRITVTDIITGSNRNARVKIGITAPDEISVDREEVREEKDKERRKLLDAGKLKD